MSDLIKRPAHVALEVPDIDASVRWATTVMGMRETRRDGATVYLTHGDCHHSLQYIASDRSALDHVALEAHDAAALDALAAKLDAAGVALISDTPQEHGVDRAIRFAGPAGHVIEVFAGMASAGAAETSSGVQPRKFAHPMLAAEDTGPTVAMLIETLGFRLSDDADAVVIGVAAQEHQRAVADVVGEAEAERLDQHRDGRPGVLGGQHRVGELTRLDAA